VPTPDKNYGSKPCVVADREPNLNRSVNLGKKLCTRPPLADSHISFVLRADQSRPAAESRGAISHFDHCFRRDLTSSQLDPASRSREYSSRSLSSNAFSSSLGFARPLNNCSSSSCQIRSQISRSSTELSFGSCSKISA